MDVRVQAYWVRQADAVERNRIFAIAVGVNMGMAGGDEMHKAMDALELTKSAEQKTNALWEGLAMVGGR